MQNYILRFVEGWRARCSASGCSIARAIESELRTMERARLLKLRDASLELQQIVEAEIIRQDDAVLAGAVSRAPWWSR